MNSIVTSLIDATQDDLAYFFTPELTLCSTIVLMLLVRLCNLERRIPSYWVALLGSLMAFCFALFQFRFTQTGPFPLPIEWVFNQLAELWGLNTDRYLNASTYFTGLLVFDQFAVYFRLFLLLFLILVTSLTVLSGIPDNEDGPDFYTLLLGSVVGMMLMSSANHLLILFLGIEMASVPSYAMVGFLKGRRRSSEASLKFVVYGAGAAGVMLYGISLLCGLTGSGDLSVIALRLAATVGEGESTGLSDPHVRLLVLAVTMIFVGFAFKLSVVPFHFWCPDAFEGAPAEVAGFLSVASKAAAFALLVRFCLALTGTDPGGLQNIYMYLGVGIGVIAALTSTFGNLAAYTQTNAKRLLAYSTIAHAGYMLMAVAAFMVVKNAPLAAGLDVNTQDEQARRCLEGLLYYLAVYLFMNLGAFAIVALIRNQTFSEELEDYKGLATQTPTLCVCMLICVFSLIGLPPFGGFIGKIMIFASLVDAGAIHWSMWAVLAVGCLNTVISLFYYLRILKPMFLEPRPDGARAAVIPFNSSPGLYVVMVSVPVFLLGFMVQGLSLTAQSVAELLVR